MRAAQNRFAAAITGIGLVTAAGTDTKQTWNEITSATVPSAVRRPPVLQGLPCDFMYTIEDLDTDEHLGADIRLMDRFAQLAVIAAREAVADAGLDPETWDGTRVAVVIGSAHGGLNFYDEQQTVLTERGARRVSPKVAPLSVPNNATSSVCKDLGARGPSLAVSTACASGTDAIGTALGWLRAGRCDIAVAGGAESLTSRLVFASTCQMKALSTRVDDPATACRPFDVDRDGFVVGEGAGLLVLEHPDHAHARGATPRARLAGYGSSNDAFSCVAPDESGTGIETALRAALTDADLSARDVGHVNTHGTSTVMNDLVESAALHRVLGEAPLLTSTKAMTGHALGAAGGIEAALTALTLEAQLIPPTANLTRQDPGVPLEVVAKAARRAHLECAATSSLGFGGHNAVLLLTRT
ncbi:beta-ketoacyl-[acyl-carrier-protein] synthase family protein [Streptomyces sp. NPDC102406]|uniref:beta-ketoacyl-[acyl-carrier-protein] synthase family protein n=1 Tax=Streptomyces sp. NPDC102406 TaxID=3366171 RepID=UPI00380D6006